MNASELFGEATKVGQVVQAPGNLEGATVATSQYLRCDGRWVLRADLTANFLSKYTTPGNITMTARTLAAAPATASIAKNATYFAAAGVAGAGTQIQTSTDGITYTSRAGDGTANGLAAVVYGTAKFVIKSVGNNYPYHQADPTVAFTQAATFTGVDASSACNCLAYSASLGRILWVGNFTASTSYAATTNDDGANWSAQTVASAATKQQCCWTGSNFLVTNTDVPGMIQSSATGLTGAWSDIQTGFAYATSTTLPTIASDGANNAVMIAADGCSLLVSHDHGATWGRRLLPTAHGNAAPSKVVSVSCANGIFFAAMDAAITTSSTNVFMSSNGDVWLPPGPAVSTSFIGHAVAYKAGVYAAIRSANTSAATFTIGTTHVRLPDSQRSTASAAGFGVNSGFQEFIRVR